MTSEPWSVSAAGRNRALALRVDHAAAEVLAAFDQAGIPALLIKGLTVAGWLYDEGEPRAYGDSDILVAPSGWEAAARRLSELGYQPSLDETAMPEWWREHAVTWFSPQHGVVVDLHRTIRGSRVDPERTWAVLSPGAERLLLAGCEVAMPAAPARALLCALNAATSPPVASPARTDLERALARLGEQTWRSAAGLAGELDATGAFAYGLRLLPTGRELADRLGLGHARPMEIALRAAVAPYQALTIERLARAPGVRRRLAIIARKLVPPATFMRASTGRLDRRGLAVAYVQRPFRLASAAPRAFRAWLRARAEVRSD